MAWLLASYARDGLARVEASGEIPSLRVVRAALEDALGVRYEDERGSAFFRSTLVQTLFYGIFSAYVLWARHSPSPMGSFDWRTAVWHLRVPVLRALFQQISDPGRLQPLGLVEVLDWAAAALDRIDRESFFDQFGEGEAVTYFYEPFLEAFDPALRKQLGVWYTPTEVVRYMVARVDRALREDLGIAEGLAAQNVYILDPCCGTGTYLAEVLRCIARTLKDQGLGALTGAQVKEAAMTRVFGFEIMPAPFVVAHLQIGLTMQALDAALSKDGMERAGIFLTNALTGWEPKAQKPLPFQELEEERDRAQQVKQDRPVLVILGNPPYNGFAGMAVDEESDLTKSYRQTKEVQRPQGQGLNDLYVRFFRMAERRIVEKTGQGIVCFISNYSWLDGLSFTGMRERYLEAFDIIRIDCLNGDKFKTGKTTPDGRPDPSIFSAPEDPVGIQVGTAITTMVRKGDHRRTELVDFRHLWGQTKREELTATAKGANPSELYDDLSPALQLGLPFTPVTVSKDWSKWPALPDLFPVSFPGVKTSRDSFLVDIDKDRLRKRMTDYSNSGLSHDEIAHRYPSAMRSTNRYDARAVREALLQRQAARRKQGRDDDPVEDRIVRYSYRPFDNRWLYWEGETKLLDEKRAKYKSHVLDGNLWLVAQQKPRRNWSRPQLISEIGCLDLMDRGATCFPVYLRDDGLRLRSYHGPGRPNLSEAAQCYLDRLGMDVDDLFHHVLAVLHDPSYRQDNAGALIMGWPRIPLPGWPDGTESNVAVELAKSAHQGKRLATLLDCDAPVPRVTTGQLRPEIAKIAVPSTSDGTNMSGDDFAVTAGWGYSGAGDAIMPSQGRVAKHNRNMGGTTLSGDTALDIYLNERAYWSNVPSAVWNYKLGGYQVLKKWLSYRERKVLGRALLPEEVQHFTDTARRIAAILLIPERSRE